MLICVLITTCGCAAALAQGLPGGVVGAGYAPPRPVRVAPGQVINLFVQGLDSGFAAPILASPAGVRSVAGVTAKVEIRSQKPVFLPILELRPLSTCAGFFAPCASFVVVTVQLPYKLPVNRPGSKRMIYYRGMISVYQNGAALPGIAVVPIPDSLHILTSDDIGFSEPKTSGANGIIFHSDGTPVSYQKPAAPLEALTADVVGAGVTSPPLPPGLPAPDGTYSTVRGFDLKFDFRGAVGDTTEATSGRSPRDHAGAVLKTGFVGVYEIRFRAPAAPTGCCPTPQVGTSVLSWTVTITGAASSDTAPMYMSYR
jgi:hypothetical protein